MQNAQRGRLENAFATHYFFLLGGHSQVSTQQKNYLNCWISVLLPIYFLDPRLGGLWHDCGLKGRPSQD